MGAPFHLPELEIAPAPVNLWTRWRGYLARWLLFGLVISVFQPVADAQTSYWLQKTYQGLAGLLFGLACALVFTPLENKFNTPRQRWKTAALVFASWLLVKVVVVSTLALF